MSLVWASVLLVFSLPFLLWPLLRHHELTDAAEAATSLRRQEATRRAARETALLAIEEVELDEASGRLDTSEARSRLAELRSDAERILRLP